MGTLDFYNHGHNVLALHNCIISTAYDLFQVLLRLNLIRTPKILFMPFLHFDQGAMFQPELCR